MIGQEKKCIFLELNEFRALVNSLYEEDVYVDADLEGITVGLTEDDLPAEDLHERLAHYFYVDGITSIHIDDYEPCGVWLVCKNNKIRQHLGDGISIIAEEYPDPSYKDICVSLQDDISGIVFQDLVAISPETDDDGKPLHGKYKLTVYPDGEDENKTETFHIKMHGYYGTEKVPFEEGGDTDG